MGQPMVEYYRIQLTEAEAKFIELIGDADILRRLATLLIKCFAVKKTADLFISISSNICEI